jgi:polyisoprenoid-binding protein YceI
MRRVRFDGTRGFPRRTIEVRTRGYELSRRKEYPIVRRFLQRPAARIVLGIAVIGVLAIAIGAFYLVGSAGDISARSVAAPTLSPSKHGSVFAIDQSSSQVRFTMQEVLFGQPNTVVGKTNQVTGQVLVNEQNPSQSRMGQIRIDLSALLTDNDFRNRALQGRILETGDPSNRYATFTETSIKGLPNTITPGQTVAFQITGNLTIHGVTRSVTFSAQATMETASRVTAQAHTTIQYQDYNLAIPNIPSVTSVSQDVQLTLSLTMHA